MYKLAFKTALPIALGYFVVSFAFGMACVSHGLAMWVPVAMSIFIYAGSGQFILLALFIQGSTVLTIILSVFLINSRHILMSMYMNNHFKYLHFKKIHKIIYASELTDESFAFHSLDKKSNLKNHHYYISFNMICHIFWVMGSFFGAVLFKYYGNIISIKLDYALIALMIYVFVILIDSKLKLLIAIISIIIGTILKFTINTNIDIFITTFIVTGLAVWLKKKI